MEAVFSIVCSLRDASVASASTYSAGMEFPHLHIDEPIVFLGLAMLGDSVTSGRAGARDGEPPAEPSRTDNDLVSLKPQPTLGLDGVSIGEARGTPSRV
jgi:hypothetical protein